MTAKATEPVNHLDKGRLAEQAACRYLNQQGLSTLARNIRYPFGELDIIMLDAKVLVFVEVRYRRTDSYGGAISSITRAKQFRLERAASAWLQQNKDSHSICRFDLMALSGDINNLKYHWLKNIFQ